MVINVLKLKGPGITCAAMNCNTAVCGSLNGCEDSRECLGRAPQHDLCARRIGLDRGDAPRDERVDASLLAPGEARSLLAFRESRRFA